MNDRHTRELHEDERHCVGPRNACVDKGMKPRMETMSTDMHTSFLIEAKDTSIIRRHGVGLSDTFR